MSQPATPASQHGITRRITVETQSNGEETQQPPITSTHVASQIHVQEQTFVQAIARVDSTGELVTIKANHSHPSVDMRNEPTLAVRPNGSMHEASSLAASTTLSSILSAILLVGLFALYAFYVSQFIAELNGWNDLVCDGNPSLDSLTDSGAGTNTTGSGGIVYLSSTGANGVDMSKFDERTDTGKLYLVACCVIQGMSLLGTIAFGLSMSSSSSLVTLLGVLLDAITLGIFAWGVWLYLSGSVCSFYFFRLTLVYCIVQVFLLILLANAWGVRARTKRRGLGAVSADIGGRRTVIGDGRTSSSDDGESGSSSAGGGGRRRVVGGTNSPATGLHGAEGKHYPPSTGAGMTPDRVSTTASGGRRGPTLTRGGTMGRSHSTLPTLKPFQHPDFPSQPVAAVPLFVVQNAQQHGSTPTYHPDDDVQAEDVQDVETEHVQ